MGFLIYEHGLYNNGTTLKITIEEMLSRTHLPPIYVHSQASIEELRGLLFLAGQGAEVKSMSELHPDVISANAHYIAVYPVEMCKWT